MRATWTIAAREIRSFFASPLAYIVLLVWLLWCGVSFYFLSVYLVQRQGFSSSASDTPLHAFFGGTTLFYLPLLVFVPVLTMRLLAEEQRSGTIEPLLTAPVSSIEVVLGKYLAAVVFWIALWLPTLMYVWITSRYGSVDLGTVGAVYLGVFGLGLYYMAIGVAASAAAKNQIVAALLTFLALGTLFALGIGEHVFEGQEEVRAVFAYLNVWTHMEAFSKGVVDLRYIVYDVSLAGLAIFLATRILEARRVATRAPGTVLAVAGSLLVCAIVIMGNYLAFRHYTRWDWTSKGLFTLSDKTEQVLGRVHGPVDVYVFLSSGEPSLEDVRELVERYKAKQNRITARYVDPDRQPGEYQLLAQRFGLGAALLESGGVGSDAALVVVSGDKKWTISRDDLISQDLDSVDDESGGELDVKAEQALTGAIVQVTSGRATKVCVTKGHGEVSLDGGERSLTGLKDALRRDNVEMQETETLGKDRVPEGCDAVYVVGPLEPFNADESRLLDAYVRQHGGNLLIAVDPVPEREVVRATGLEQLAAGYGVTIGADVVVELDSARLLTPNPIEAFFVDDYGEHRTTRALGITHARSVFRVARSVRAEPQGGATVLARTSAEAYAETSLGDLVPGQEPRPGPGDLRGPVPVAVAAEVGVTGDTKPGGRLVVVGDADWMLSDVLEQPGLANYDLASAWTGWLAERDALIAIAPKRVSARSVIMSEEDLSGLLFRVLVLMPGAALLMGLAVWWTRRS